MPNSYESDHCFNHRPNHDSLTLCADTDKSIHNSPVDTEVRTIRNSNRLSF